MKRSLKLILLGVSGSLFLITCNLEKIEEGDPMGAPNACFTISPNNGGLAPSTVSFDANCSTKDSTYLWDFGDAGSGSNNMATTAVASHIYSSPGSYNVKLTITDGHGAADETNMAVVIGSSGVLDASFTYSPDMVNVGCSVAFTSTSTGATSYQWNFGDDNSSSTAQNPLHTFATAGVWGVTLTVSNGSNTDIVTAVVTAYATKTYEKFNFGTGNCLGIMQTSDGNTLQLLSFHNSISGCFLLKTNSNTGLIVGSVTSWNLSGGNDYNNVIESIEPGYAIVAGGGSGELHWAKLNYNSNGDKKWDRVVISGGTGSSSGEIFDICKNIDGNGYLILSRVKGSGQSETIVVYEIDDVNGDIIRQMPYGTGTENYSGNGITPSNDGGYVITGSIDNSTSFLKVNELLMQDPLNPATVIGSTLVGQSIIRSNTNSGYIIAGTNGLLRVDENGTVITSKATGSSVKIINGIDGNYVIASGSKLIEIDDNLNETDTNDIIGGTVKNFTCIRASNSDCGYFVGGVRDGAVYLLKLNSYLKL